MKQVMIAFATLSTATLPLWLDTSLKGAALLILAAMSALILRKASASTRHLVWLFAMGALLLLPAFSALLPGWAVLPRLNNVTQNTAPLFNSNNLLAPFRQSAAVELELPVTSAARNLPVQDIPPTKSFHIRDWLMLVWIAGIAMLLIRLAAAQWFLGRAESRCTLVRDKRLAETNQDVRRQLNLRRPVPLLLDSRRTIPMTWGVFRPRVLLPAEAVDWDETRLRAVLLHEMAHIKRGDAVVRWLAQLSCALHWFNPLVWLAAWRLHVESERACDDLVLTNGIRASDYAKHLLHVATNLSSVRMTQACSLTMACNSRLEGRLLAVLNRQANRRRVSRALTFAALTIGLGLVIPVAMLRAAPEKTSSDVVVEGDADNQISTNEGHATTVIAAETNSPLPGTTVAKPPPIESVSAGSNEVNRIKLVHAESELQRAVKLREQNLISEPEFNKATAQVDIARAELAGRQEDVARIKLRTAETELARLLELQKANAVSKASLDQAQYKVALLRVEMTGDAAEAARVRFSQAESDFKRASQLHEQSVISEIEYNRARQHYEAFLAESDLLHAKARALGTATSAAEPILIEARIIEAPARARIPDDPSKVTSGNGIAVLSSPRIVTGAGKEAEIFIGKEQPSMNAASGTAEFVRAGITMRVTPELKGDRIAYTVRLTLCDLVHTEAKDTQTVNETSSRELHLSGTAKDGEGTWFHLTEQRNGKKIAVWLQFKRQR